VEVNSTAEACTDRFIVDEMSAALPSKLFTAGLEAALG
jgi:hypothetical protein